MRISQVLLVLLYMVYAVHAQAVWPYDCRVISASPPCGVSTASYVGTCTSADGTCNCAQTADYNCGTDSTDISTCTTDPCNEAGSTACKSDSDGCVCKEDYVNPPGATGPAAKDCSTERVQISCHNDGADIKMYPYAGSDFGGSIFLAVGDNKYPDCKLTCTNGECVSSTRLLYVAGTASTSLGETCPAIAESTADGVTTREFKLYVQHNDGSFSTTDRVFSVTCKTGNVPIEVIISSGTVNTVPVTETGTVTGDTETGVTATLTDTNGAITSASTISSGDELTLTVSAAAGVVKASGGTFTDISMRNVFSYNYDKAAMSTAPANAVTVKIVEDWCVKVSFVTAFTKPTVYDDAQPFNLVLKFKAFVFPTTSGDSPTPNTGASVSSQIWLEILICTGECTGAACSYGNKYPDMLLVPGTGSGRKRRQVTGSGQNKPVELLLNFTVGTPSQYSTCAATKDSSDHEECYTTLAFILPLVMMAVLLLLALIMVYVFFTKMSHAQNGGMNGETNLAYKS